MAPSPEAPPIDAVSERIALPGGEVELARPRDAEALLSEESFERDEFLPYWAELWSSAVALAHDVSMRSLRGRRTLELGCGLGLPSIAAALAGGRVVANDWSPEAMAATAANAERNGASVETLLCSWASPAPLVERGRVLIADPGRPPAEAFLERAAEDWHVRTIASRRAPRVSIHRLRRRV